MARTRAGGTTGRIARVRPTASGWVLLVLASLPVTGLLRDSAVVGTPTTAALVIALLVIAATGLIVPVVMVRRTALGIAAPRDAVVGDTIDLDVDLAIGGFGSAVRLRPHLPTGPWMRLHDGDRGRIPHHLPRRGLVDHVVIEVGSTGPFGMFDARAVVRVPIAPIRVAPRPLRVGWRSGTVDDEGDVTPTGSNRPGGETTRTVREYAPGDPARLVHWPTTARLGELVVRELEPPEPHGQAIVLELTGLAERTETAASYAMGAGLAVLAAGGRLFLCTAGPEGPEGAEIRTPIQLGRRLAVAVEGPTGTPPAGWPIVEIGV